MKYCVGKSALDGRFIVSSTETDEVLDFASERDAEAFVEGKLLHFDVLVTRHEGLVKYLQLKGYTWDKHITHASKDDVMNKNILGVLPFSLAQWAESVTECALTLPENLRGLDLTLEQMEPYAGEIITYLPPRVADNWF